MRPLILALALPSLLVLSACEPEPSYAVEAFVTATREYCGDFDRDVEVVRDAPAVLLELFTVDADGRTHPAQWSRDTRYSVCPEGHELVAIWVE